MNQYMRQAMVVARRDFLAIVATPTFLLFLLAPLMMLAFGMIGGLGAAAVADNNEGNARLVVIAEAEQIPLYKAAEQELTTLNSGLEPPAPLTYLVANDKPGIQATNAMKDVHYHTYAVLYGDPANPVILQQDEKSRSGAYLSQLSSEALLAMKLGADKTNVTARPDFRVAKDMNNAGISRKLMASVSVILLFMLTLILASQAVGMLAEEKGNKVIEILAAAAPLESVFFGKLVGMLGVALLFISFWVVILGGGLAAGLTQMPDPTMMQTLSDVKPMVGWPMFAILFLVYFILAFLLLGAIFLGIGAQAATMREIQMLSLPLTILQFAMFGLSSAAAGAPGSTVARTAEIIPFSSPLAMSAHAVHDAALWPHLLAIVWQVAWLALTIWLSVRMFRAGVLKSGSGWYAKLAGRGKIAMDEMN